MDRTANIGDIAIIGNGGFPRKKAIYGFICKCRLVIFCDGAFWRFTAAKDTYGLKDRILSLPCIVTGDMDSIKPEMKGFLSAKGVLKPNPDQETNDQTKAFETAMDWISEDIRRRPHTAAASAPDNAQDIPDNSADVPNNALDVPDNAPASYRYRINFIGATGLREDHTIGNMGLLMEYAGHKAVKDGQVALRMISDYCIAFPMTGSGSFECGTGRAISIFSPDSSLRLVSDGLQWQTENVRFTNWWQATLNRSSKKQVALEFSHPSKVLVTLDFRPSDL